MKTTKRIFALFLVLVTLCSTLAVPALAASWPSLSSSRYCEMRAPGKISVYRDSGLRTRGTSSPAKSYNASISQNDKIYIYKITGSYAQVNYPTSSGRRTGYVKTSTLFGVSSPSRVISSKAKVTTCWYASSSSQAGYVAAKDTVYKLGTTKNGYVLVIYPAASGSRAYKAAFVTKADYQKMEKTDPDENKNNNTNGDTSGWQWPVSGYSISQSFNRRRSNNTRPYHCGVDMTSSSRGIYAAADGTVVYKGYSSGNGYHVILSHNINGKTVKTLYSHLSSYSSCPAVGKAVAKGAKIGVMGSTGNSTGVHLHFAVFTGSSNDPVGYATSGGSNKISHNGCVFYNPSYVISNGRLP